MPYASLKQRTPDNVPGKYYVTDACTNCGRCRELAPSHFAENTCEHYSRLQKQPATPEADALCDKALENCPSRAIWADGDLYDWDTIKAEPELRTSIESKIKNERLVILGVLTLSIAIIALVRPPESAVLPPVLVAGVIGALSSFLFTMRRSKGPVVGLYWVTYLAGYLTYTVLDQIQFFTTPGNLGGDIWFAAVATLGFTIACGIRIISRKDRSLPSATS